MIATIKMQKPIIRVQKKACGLSALHLCVWLCDKLMYLICYLLSGDLIVNNILTGYIDDCFLLAFWAEQGEVFKAPYRGAL